MSMPQIVVVSLLVWFAIDLRRMGEVEMAIGVSLVSLAFAAAFTWI